MIQSPYDSIFLFACLFFIPFVSHHKTRLISAKGRRPNGPKEPGRENKETDCRRAMKKNKKREIEKKRKTEQKDEKRKKAMNWNERIRTWKVQ